MPSSQAHRGGSSRVRSRLLRALVVMVTAGTAGLATSTPAQAYPADLGGGSVHRSTYDWSFPSTSGARGTSGSYGYLLYTPMGWTPDDQLPLYVLLHGCPSVEGQGAEAMMQATRMNPIADRERFVVLYADNNASCWHASSPGRAHSVRGGGGDADIVAGMTREAMSAYNVDPERVYIMGFSSGSSQASATAYAYPDLYAAVGVNAGSGPNMDTSCNATSDDMAPFFAESTVEQMGIYARPMPFFGIGGDGVLGGEEDFAGWVDPTGLHPKVSGCTRIAYMEALDIDHILIPDTEFRTSYEKTGQVTAAEDGTPVTGVPWRRQVALDGNSCPIAENWIVGTGHKWMGGSTDPAYAVYGINDVNAPSGGEASWAFFKQFTLHGGNAACHPVSAGSGPGGGGRPGPYRASASATLLTAQGLHVAGQRDASHLTVSPVSAMVDSAAKGSSPKAAVDARSLTSDLLSPGEITTYGVEARQAAPPGNTLPLHEQAAAVPAAPLLNADLATADVHARWSNSAGCVTDGPIATASSSLANAQVQPDGADDGGSNWHGNTLGMDDYISPAGTGTSTSVVELTRHEADDRYALRASATTQVTGINVSDALYVEVVAPAKAEVLATGLQGTAAVALSQPVLRTQGATLVSGRTFTTTISGGPVVEITPGIVTKHLSTDGTRASASGTLAHIRVLDVTGAVTLADVTLGTIAATASVPVGGVSCPSSSRPSAPETPAVAAPEGRIPGAHVTHARGDERAAAQTAATRIALAAAVREPSMTLWLALLAIATLGGLWLRRVLASPLP